MDLGLSDRVAVVFAASRGLGLATARRLAEEGCRLAIASRNRDRIEAAAGMIRASTGRQVLAMAIDVTDPKAITTFAEAVRDTYGACDVLINNSGGPKPGTFDTLSDEDFTDACRLLLLNVVRCTKAFLPLIRLSRQGRVITITSTATREILPNLMLSNAVRAAVAGWSKTLAREIAAEGVTVNCVAPGTIGTERIDELVAANAARLGKPREAVLAELIARIPAGRFGRPEEFASAVAFLASNQATFITGTTLYVDGGQMATVV